MTGKWISLSPMRRIVGDLLHMAKSVPTVPVQRRMHLGQLMAARAACSPHPPWSALFLKAFARTAAEIPELRRAYVKFPWAHLYEHPVSIASFAVEREYAGERTVFFGLIKDVGNHPIPQLTNIIRRFQETPIKECGEFRRTLRLSRFPKPLRRLLWWLGMNVAKLRTKHFGTFLLTTYSALGAESLHPISPSTATLNYGVIAPDGQVDVRLIYDHRVLDGSTVARALARLEQELTTNIVAELQGLASTAQSTFRQLQPADSFSIRTFDSVSSPTP